MSERDELPRHDGVPDLDDLEHDDLDDEHLGDVEDDGPSDRAEVVAFEWRVLAAAREILASGPQPLDELVEEIDAAGSLLDELRAHEAIDGDEDGVAAFVYEALLDGPDVWPTQPPDRVVGLASQLVDGRVFTHRLTEEEIERGEVWVTPDLLALSWAAKGDLRLEGGETLGWVLDLGEPGDDRNRFAGPEGWLDGFAPGDLLALTQREGRVTVEAAPELADDDRELALLRPAIEEWIPPGQGEEALPLLLDTLTRDPDTFRRPVRPAAELLAAAGLERRGFSFGRADEEWKSARGEYVELQRRRVVQRHGLDRCCEEQLERVLEALEVLRGASDPGVGDTRAIARALDHGAVAPAVADVVLGTSLGGDRHLAALGEAVSAEHPGRAAPAHLLVALEAERRGDVATAEARLRGALEVDPDYEPAAAELSEFELDRGHLDRAVALLRHRALTETDRLEVLELYQAMVEGPYRDVGRNDRCPCGSGRKFKMCCQRTGPRPRLDVRVMLLTQKLASFVSRPHRRPSLLGLASSAVDSETSDPRGALREVGTDLVLLDLLVAEGGRGEEYLEERGALLADHERELLEEMLAVPRRLWEVIEAEEGAGVRLRDAPGAPGAPGGEVVLADDQNRSTRWSPGDLVVARVGLLEGGHRLVGPPVDVPPAHREATLEVLEPPVDADELAEWYGAILRDEPIPARVPADPPS